MNVGWLSRLQRPGPRHQLLLLLGFLTGNLLALLLSYSGIFSYQKQPDRHYTYSTYTASNGVKLHAMRTSPENIELKHITTNVTRTGEFGINGGFFWNGDLLSIAIIGDRPLRGAPHDYGSGWYNIDLPKGTLVWDEVKQAFSVQVVIEAGELQVADRSRYWAQGGVSMSLGSGAFWAAQALRENMPAFTEARLRSGAVYDKSQQLWMLVSDGRCTVEQFRTALLEVIAPGQLVDGVFLDGDGSSQMLSDQVALDGDTREVYQMMALKEK